jgi:RimJ/RimL family protein N-acetyltransferase
VGDETPPRHSAFLIGEKVTLRPHTVEDVPVLSRICNHPETRFALFHFQPKTDREILREMERWEADPHSVRLAICERDSGRAVGSAALVRIDWVSRAAIFFIAIGDPADWSKGFGGEATRLMCDHAFETLGLQRLQLHVWAQNERAVRAYERAGFEREGTLRRAMFHAGRYEDFLVMARLRPLGEGDQPSSAGR